MGDRYDEMKGPELATELQKRELSITGKVDELRDRLREDDETRAQKVADDPNPAPEGEETTEDVTDVPEPREPVDYDAGKLVLTETQARTLNAGEAAMRRHFRYVFRVATRKYGAGDSVVCVMDWDNGVGRVLPFGIEVPLDTEDESTDGLARLREANDQQNEG